jgi:hypothetical protein
VEGTADRVIRFLVENARCTDCGGDFRSEDVYVLDERDRREWDLGAVCHGCHTLTLIRAIVEPDGVETRARHAIASELTPAERRHFRALGPLNQDDVLDVAAFLTTFHGDFRELFGREPEVE